MLRGQGVLLGLAAVFAFAQPVFASDAESGKALFAQRCASCHGAMGAGDGPVAMALPPEQKPRNLTSGPMKYATDDEKLRKVIKEGGQAVGLSPLMPAQPDLDADGIESLVLFVKSLKK